jgi:hypothetical protein
MANFDSTTTRFRSGLTNAAPWQALAASGCEDPSWTHQYHNDFDTFYATDWTATVTGAGTQALTPADGGALLLSNTSGIADATYMQLKNASFQLLAGKAVFFKFNGTLSDVINDVFYCGLLNTSTTPLTATDGIYIKKATGQAGLTLNTVIGGVTTTVPFQTPEVLVAGTAFEVDFMVDYLGNVAAFFNPTTGDSTPITAANAAAGQARGRVAAIYAPSLTQVLLNPSFGLLNSTAAARTLQVDYVTVLRNR